MKFAIAFLLLTTSAFAKTFPAVDGVIPAQFVEQIRKYEKTFTGKIEGRDAQVRLVIDSANRLSLEYTDSKYNDMTGMDCRSSIKNIVSVDSQIFNTSVVKSATFAFDKGGCMMIEGNTVEVYFNVARGTKEPAITTSLQDRTIRIPGTTYCTPYGGCHQQPDTYTMTFITGKFF